MSRQKPFQNKGVFEVMENLRGHFDTDSDQLTGDADVEDNGHDGPPAEIGKDERRMQVRAYNFWASLLDNRNFPSIEDLDPQDLPDFGPNSVLLDFSRGVEDPGVGFLGSKLAIECDAEGLKIENLNDVPSRSLLTRITDHYMQIIANQAPIGFEAEFVNQRGATILYRGILLPFSSDDDTIDFIYGVINWKEMAQQSEADALLKEIDKVLESSPQPLVCRKEDELTDWADGPGVTTGTAPINLIAPSGQAHTPSGFGAELPNPSFNLDDMSAPSPKVPVELLPSADMITGGDFPAQPDLIMPELDISPVDMELGDWLAAAREMAEAARSSEDRTRNALYDAISHAYDFSLAAAEEPEEFAELLEDSGLRAQKRAPMTPIVKLVFGAEYDKTRLTEYAAALGHAHRASLERGALNAFLRDANGGLKGIVQKERALRREESGAPVKKAPTSLNKTTASKLRKVAPVSGINAISNEGSEFALIMVRRTEAGEMHILGEVPEDTKLVEKAARRLLN